MADAINFNGKVEWSGENPGISLKEHPDGPWTNLASFFRVVLSPYGRGHALVLLQSPNEANPPEGRLPPQALPTSFCCKDIKNSKGIDEQVRIVSCW